MINPNDIRILSWTSEKGSAWSFKVPAGVEILHIPTGKSFYCESHRSQHRNKQECLDMLYSYLKEITTE